MRLTVKNYILTACSAMAFVFIPCSVYGEDQPNDLSLRLEVDDVIHRCLTVIEEEQNPDGFWSSPDYPGLTALVLRAIIESPVDSEKWIKSETVAKGIAFLKKNVKEDGGIYNRGLHSYNTAISLMCLNVYSEAAKKHGLLDKDELSELKQTMIRARDFVVRQQQIYTEEILSYSPEGSDTETAISILTSRIQPLPSKPSTKRVIWWRRPKCRSA
jgi:hypothetical protein